MSYEISLPPATLWQMRGLHPKHDAVSVAPGPLRQSSVARLEGRFLPVGAVKPARSR
jgi:hypothetical protein